MAVLSAFFGGTRIAVPDFGNSDHSTGIPFRRELPLLSAVFLTAALGGDMATHEESGTSRAHGVRTGYLAGLTVIACGVSFVVEAVAVGSGGGAVYLRSVLIWFGLALVSVRIFGSQLGWVVPLASVFPLIWWGPAWWDWTTTRSVDPFSWGLAALAVSLGLVATAITPWRLRRMKNRWLPGRDR
ncbi:hypothetical protein [Streptomyces sp. NPDC013181]|uniref:hypothetical protein n=1 Tax=unclassified Streptomyces TaxID=2593676 RepID=UPI0036B4F310